MIPLKTYSGKACGMKYAFPIYHADMRPHGAAHRIVALIGVDGFGEFMMKIVAGNVDCATCAKTLKPDITSPLRPGTFMFAAMPKYPMAGCACVACTERYGSAQETARMCAEAMLSFTGNQETIVSDMPADGIVELKEDEAD